MPRMYVSVAESSKMTTRDGTHPDDEAYTDQVKAQLELAFKEMGFTRAEVIVELRNE